jgi:hypothetical protein
MRDVVNALEQLDLAWYLTGSEALAAYGAPRQTLDTDLVLDAPIGSMAELAQALESDHYFAEPLRIGNRWMASLVDQTGGGKVDLIIRDDDPWARAAMDRRRPWKHPVWGPVWVSSPEDLILAKLEWSEGTSELQLRDCRMLLRMNAQDIDGEYLTRWARALGVSELLQAVSEGESDAS